MRPVPANVPVRKARIPYMTRVGPGWRFTLRLPSALRGILSDDSDPQPSSPFVRASFGPMTCREARGLSEAAAAKCRSIFALGLERLQGMLDAESEHEAGVTGSIYAGLSAEKRAVVDEVLASTTAALERLKGVRPGQTPPHLLLASTLDQLKAFEAAARFQPAVAQHLHEPAREAVRAMLRNLGRNEGVVDGVENFVDIAPGSPKPSAGVLFSVACKRYIKELADRKSMSVKDVRRYEQMLSFFRKVAGDREVSAYEPTDIMTYVALLRTLPTRFSPADVVVVDGRIREGGPAPKKTLSSGTIASYLAPVRSIFIRECRALGTRNPCDAITIRKPGKNRPSRTRPIPFAILNRAIELGCDEGALAAIVMPPLALLTARRIGLLTYLNRDWIEKVGDHYLVRPTETVVLPQREHRTPIKTDESFTPFVLHEKLIQLGILDLMNERKFLFAEALETEDPPAALSKRMNALLKRSGARGRAFGETFHALRSRGIVHYRACVPQAVRLQSGHAAMDEHETYDWAEIEPELVPTIATVPLPQGLELSPIERVSWREAIAAERRLLSARQKRRRETVKAEIASRHARQANPRSSDRVL